MSSLRLPSEQFGLRTVVTVCLRCDTHGLPEHICEMALAGESQVQCNFGQRGLAIRQQLLRSFHTAGLDVLPGRHSRCQTKPLCKALWPQLRQSGEIVDSELSTEPLVNKLFETEELAGRKCSTNRTFRVSDRMMSQYVAGHYVTDRFQVEKARSILRSKLASDSLVELFNRP